MENKEKKFKEKIINNLEKNTNKLKKNFELKEFIFFQKNKNFNSFELINEILFINKKGISFAKELIDYLLFINNKIVNSVEYFTRFYLKKAIKENDDKIIKLKKRKKDFLGYSSDNSFLKNLKKKFFKFINDDVKRETYKTEYISQYFNNEDKNYKYSFSFFWLEKLDEREKDYFLKFLEDFLFINYFYLKNNFFNDVVILNKARNVLKNLIKEEEKNILIKNKNFSFSVLYEKFFLYLNKEEIEKLEKLTFSFLYKKISFDNRSSLYNKWNLLYKDDKNENPKLNYKDWMNFRLSSKNQILKEDFCKDKIFFSFLKKEKRNNLNEIVNDSLKRRFFSENKLFFQLSKLRAKNFFILYRDDENFYNNIIHFFLKILEINESDFKKCPNEEKQYKKKYVLLLTQFINYRYFKDNFKEELQNYDKKNSLLKYKDIKDFYLFFNFNFDFARFILKYLNLFNLLENKKIEKKILDKIRHCSFNYLIEIEENLKKGFFTKGKIIEIERNSFSNFIDKISKFIKENFKINEPNKFKISNDLKNSKISEKKIKKLKEIIEEKNLKSFFDEIKNSINQNQIGVIKSYKLLTLINYIYLYKIYELFNLKNKKEENKIKQNLNNFILEFKKIINKYFKIKLEITNKYSNSSYILKSNSLMHYIKFLNKYNNEDIAKNLKIEEEKLNYQIDELLKEIKEIKNFGNLEEDIKEIKIKISDKQLTKNIIQNFINKIEKFKYEYSLNNKKKINNKKEKINLNNDIFILFAKFRSSLNIFLDLQVKTYLKKIAKEKLKIRLIDGNFLINTNNKKNIDINDLYKNKKNKEISELTKYIIALLKEKERFSINKVKLNEEYKIFEWLKEMKKNIKKLEYIGPFIIKNIDKIEKDFYEENLTQINEKQNEQKQLNKE